MKTSYFAVIVLLVILASCKKHTENISIAGYWSGIGIDNTSTATPVGFLYKDDGTARGYFNNADTNIAAKADAVYTINSDSIRTVVTVGSTVTQWNSQLNPGATIMSGIFRRTSGIYHGTYSVTKQ